jgi:hypothetical protein
LDEKDHNTLKLQQHTKNMILIANKKGVGNALDFFVSIYVARVHVSYDAEEEHLARGDDP